MGRMMTVTILDWMTTRRDAEDCFYAVYGGNSVDMENNGVLIWVLLRLDIPPASGGDPRGSYSRRFIPV